MKTLFKSVFLFYVLKFAPCIIDSRSPRFWQWAVKELNELRSRGVGFQLWRCGRLSVRDPYSYPMLSSYYYADWHPFVVCKL